MHLYRGPSAVPGRRARLGSTLPRGRRCIPAAYLERKSEPSSTEWLWEAGVPFERRMAFALRDVAAGIHHSMSGVAERWESCAL